MSRAFKTFGGGIVLTPEKIADDVDVASCSACLTVIQNYNGEVFCFGYNPWGQCGVDPGHKDGKIEIEEVVHLNKIPIPPSASIATGLQHVVSLSREGKIYTWGKGENGQLGVENNKMSHIPVLVRIQNKCTKISAGFAHSAAVCEEGLVYVWGKGLSDVKLPENEQGLDLCILFRASTFKIVFNKAKFRVLRYQDKLYPRIIKLPNNRKAIDICSRFKLLLPL
jgi:alpha-tubulin suppressor-like RCC1 family protein